MCRRAPHPSSVPSGTAASVTGIESGAFTADVRLTANFGSSPTLEGRVENFRGGAELSEHAFSGGTVRDGTTNANEAGTHERTSDGERLQRRRGEAPRGRVRSLRRRFPGRGRQRGLRGPAGNPERRCRFAPGCPPGRLPSSTPVRIRVADVLDLLANGPSFTDIIEELPDLEHDDIAASIRFATRRIDHAVIAV